MKHVSRYFPYLLVGFVFLFTFAVSLLNSDHQLSAPLYANDFNAWHMPSVAVLRGLGAAFSGYWDIEPPALFLMTSLWALVTPALWWFHILNISMQIFICWAYWRLLNKAFPWYASGIMYVASLILFFSPVVQSMFLPSEINGTFFVFIGLTILTTKMKPSWQAFWAALAFGLAGQMKEVFAFSLFALVPLYIQMSVKNWQALARVIVASVVGLALAFGLSFSYLIFTHSVAAYHEVHQSKLESFNILDFEQVTRNSYFAAQYPVTRFIHWNFPLLIFAIVITSIGWLGLTLDQRIKVVTEKKGRVLTQFELPPSLYPQAVLLFYWLGSWLGYLVQNRYGNKYDIAAIFSTHILIGLLALVLSYALISILKSIPRMPKTVVSEWGRAALFIIILVTLITPQKIYLVDTYYRARAFHPRFYIHKWSRLEDPQFLATELKIKNQTTQNDCIQGVFGWGIANLYHYSERRSCTRFFIPNIVTLDQVGEYRQSMIENPPAVIYYSLGGADLDTARFERTIFNYTAVTQQCYDQDPEIKTLYWPKLKNRQSGMLQECIKTALASVNQF